MCRETLTQNTHACGAAAHGHVTTRGCVCSRVRTGEAQPWCSPRSCRSTGGTSPSQRKQHSQGGEEGGREGCAAAKTRDKHSQGWSGDDSGIDPLELLKIILL